MSLNGFYVMVYLGQEVTSNKKNSFMQMSGIKREDYFKENCILTLKTQVLHFQAEQKFCSSKILLCLKCRIEKKN